MAEEIYRFSIPVAVRFGDIDALGHVNNAVYFTYMEQSRIEYLEHVGLPTLDQSPLSFILAEVSCQFKVPVRFGMQLEVKSRVDRLGRSSFNMLHQIEDRSSHQVMALGRSVIVVYDYAAGKSAPLPAEWRASIEKFEAGQ